MNRAFVGIALIVALVPAVIASFELVFKANSLQQELVYDAVVLEKANILEKDFKSTFSQVLESVKGFDARERAFDAGKKLSLLEKYFEDRSREEGILFDAWFGTSMDSELDFISLNSLKKGLPLKCNNCFDLSAIAFDLEGKPFPASALLLDCWNPFSKPFVSRSGRLFSPSFPLDSLKEPFFGATVVFPGKAAFVITIKEGFS